MKQFATAEDQKLEARNARNRRLIKDRKNPNGDRDLAATDGLRIIKREHKGSPVIDIDEGFQVDLRRVKSLKDVTLE